jgi:hypothetical protein
MVSPFPDLAPVSCLLLRPLMPLPVVISFLIPSCWIAPRSLMPLLHSAPPRTFLPVRPSIRGSSCDIATRSDFPSSSFDRRSFMTASVTPCHSFPGGSSFCGRWPNSSGTHHHPGCVSSAAGGSLWLDPAPHTASSVFLKFPVRFSLRSLLMLCLGPYFLSICLQILGLRLP